MPYSHSAGPTKRKQRQQLTVPCDCNLCQGKPQTYRVVRRHKQAFGKNLGIDCNEHEEDEESSSLDESVEIKIDVSSKDSPSNSEDSQQSMKCLLVSSGTEDNSEVGFHVEPFNKISTTSRPSYESLPSADDTSDDTRSETSSNSSVDEDDCETLFDPESSNSSDCQSQNSDDDTAKSITSAAESQMIEELPLYEGSSTTVLEALAGYFDWFTTHPSVSKSALSELLQFEHEHILPSGNNLPSSYEDALQFVRPFMLDTVTYHVCPNDCVIFRKTPRYDYSDLNTCPICHANRFGSNGIPFRKYVYYPLGPRWKRMFENKEMSELLQSHCSFSESCLMYDVHNSPAWKHVFAKDGVFGGDCRGLLIQLSTDGVNPFSSNKVCYSMWPVMVTILNLPKILRNKHKCVMLAGIIPTNAKSIDPYLDVLVDELIELDCRLFFDAFRSENFKFQVRLHNFVLDYPGLNKTFSCVGAGALQGCMWCELRGKPATVAYNFKRLF